MKQLDALRNALKGTNVRFELGPYTEGGTNVYQRFFNFYRDETHVFSAGGYLHALRFAKIVKAIS